MNVKNTLTFLIIMAFFTGCSKDEPSIKTEVPRQSSKEFRKVYSTNDSIFTLNTMVQLPDSSYTLGGAVRYGTSYDENVLVKIDKYGNRDWVKVMKDTYTPNGIEKLFLNNTGYIGYRGRHFSTGYENASHIIYFNESGDVQSEVVKNKDVLGNDILKEGNNFLIAGGNNYMTFRKLDQNGELIWEKAYTSKSSAYAISRLDDGNYVTIGGANTSSCQDCLMKIDDVGELIWSKPYSGRSVLAIPGNEFLAVTTGNDLSTGSLSRFDAEGNVKWSVPLANFRPDVNTPSPLKLFNFNAEYFVCTYVNQEFKLNILVLDPNGNEINLHTINDYPGTDYTLVAKTMDDGMLISYTGPLYKFGIRKLSYEDLFN